MATLPALTELDAVNEMLLSIGQAPVNTLAVAGIRDVNIARSELTKVVRSVQLYGFAFNTDPKYKLVPDIDGYLRVPDGVLRIDATTPGSGLLRRRHPSGFWAIYNQTDQTWEFTEPQEFKVVWAYEFDDLPDAARHYVALSAARKFQAKTIGSRELDGFTSEDEQRAWLALIRDERDVRGTNLFTANAQLAGSISNRSY